MKYNDLWKPLGNDKKTNMPQKKKKLQKTKKRKNNSELKESARRFCIKYLGLNKFATNIAIAYSISQKYECRMPDKNDLDNFLIRFYKSRQNDDKKYNKKFQTADEFYNSKKWKELRYIALSNSEGCCNLCGASAKDGVTLHVDHIVPRSRSQKLAYDLDNLQVLCEDCNMGKSNYDTKDWR